MPHADSPLAFATSRLGIIAWSRIAEIFSAVEAGHRKILVRSCNGAGKTATIAALCNWKLYTSPESVVLTTASSWTQVSRTLWGEIRKQARAAALFPARDITTTQIQIDDKHYAIGISPSLPENAQGFHAPEMLIVVDEATAVSRDIIDALSGNATSTSSQMILIYNPIDHGSFPFEAESTGDWHLITISAFEHPNVIAGAEVIPGAVTRTWIEDRLAAWSYEVGDDEPSSVVVPWSGKRYRKTARVASRILGEWPDDSSDSFIEPSLVRASYAIDPMPGQKLLGCDVARGGEDKTVIAQFDGGRMLPLITWTGRDLMKTAHALHAMYKDGWVDIAIDDTGVGAGVTDRLRELGVDVMPVNFGHRAIQLFPLKKVASARVEMYFVIEQELRAGAISLADDIELLQELCAPRLFEDPSNGAFRIQSKDEIKKQLGRSPDKADAVALARYAGRLRAFRNRVKAF